MDTFTITVLVLQSLSVLLVLSAVKTKSQKINQVAVVLAGVSLFVAGLIITWYPRSLVDLFLLATYGVWLISLRRIYRPKQNSAYIKKTTATDSSIFYLISANLILLSQLVVETGFTFGSFEQAYSIIIGLLSAALLVSTLISIASYKALPHKRENYTYPTVTLAIPARNETHALNESLKAALASDYEKLEILVLDDCSQDSTAKIIKNYAHQGVRFVQGTEPAASWLGKNQAYKTLLEHASGEYVIFCGVDVNVSISSVRHLVQYVLDNKLKMVSVLPQRLNLDVLAHIIQPMRYFWQLSLPRFATKYPPVISSCWMIERETANKMGGFNAVKNSIIPESYFARKLNKQRMYQYIISDTEIGITTRKRPKSQLDTALRTLYPMMGRSFAKSWLAAMVIFTVFVSPFLFLIINFELALQTGVWVAALIFTAINVIILTRVAPAAWFMALVSFPIAMIAEAVLILTSAWQYEFGEISWKGRNVCVPVMKQYSKKDLEQSAN